MTRVTTYLGVPGGPRDPASEGGYCLAICLCGACPQYPAQAARVAAQRAQEHEVWLRKQAEREARQARKRGGT